MAKKTRETNRRFSAPRVDSEEPKMDIKSILKDIEFLGLSHMTWKQKKDLESRKVVSLGGKPPKNQRLPLSVARVTMKKQKEKKEQMLEESAILRRFGVYTSSASKMTIERCRPEDRVLKTTEGFFKNGVLDVQHLLHPSAPRVTGDNSRHAAFSRGNKKNSGKKGNGKRKGGGRHRH